MATRVLGGFLLAVGGGDRTVAPMKHTASKSTPVPVGPPVGLDSRQRVAWWRDNSEHLEGHLASGPAPAWVDVRIVTDGHG